MGMSSEANAMIPIILKEFGPLHIAGIKFRLERSGIKISTCRLFDVLSHLRKNKVIVRMPTKTRSRHLWRVGP